MKVVARMYISSVDDKPDGTASISLQAVTSKENARWSQYTPSGSLNLYLSRRASGAYKTFREAMDRARARTDEANQGDHPKAYKPECLVTIEFDVPDGEDPGRATDENGKDIGYAFDEA